MAPGGCLLPASVIDKLIGYAIPYILPKTDIYLLPY